MKKILISGLTVLALAACDSGTGSDIGNGPQAPPVNPAIQTSTLLRGEVDAGYSEQLAAVTDPGTGPIVWSLAAGSTPLPTGVSLTPSGLLAGTPSESGLFEIAVQAENAVGGVSSSLLDLVVYENLFYAYAPDPYDAASNDTLGTATPLGAITPASPVTEPGPLSVTSNPAAPDVDWFAFTTPTRGTIEVEVFFSKVVGTLITGLHGDHNGAPELKVSGQPGAGGNDSLITLHDAPAGTWHLSVEAQYKNLTWYANTYAFRIRFNDLTIESDLIELDTGAQPAQLHAFDGGVSVAGGTWTIAAGSLQSGLSLSPDGLISGTPTQDGLERVTVDLTVGAKATSREIAVRVFNSTAGDYWQRLGEHRYFNATNVNGDGAHHELYCEATVVAPHPDYNGEGAIYVIGGREVDTIANVHVFHTTHQANADRNYKLEDINRPLTSERQYLGAAYLQHSYGGYIYIVGGELYSNTAPSSGDYTRVVERMQVADAAGVALASPGNWETLAELPSDNAGRAIEGWAEFGLVADDAAVDANDRLYLVGGRIRIEDTPASTVYQYEYNTDVLMFEAPLTSTGSGTWYEKLDATPYTPRRMPMVGMVNGRIYIIGGRAPTGTADYIEMYEPDPVGTNPALAVGGPSGFPTLAEPVWYGAYAVHNGAIYLLNGWKLQGYSPAATSRLQRFTPNAAGTGGVMDQLTAPDNPSGYHSAVFHDGKLWFVTGRDSFTPTPKYSLRYEP